MMSTPRVSRPVLIIASIVAAVVLLYLLRGALFPFIVGTALAYMVHPVVKAVEGFMPWRRERPHLSRFLAILIVYLAAIGIIAGSLLIIIPPAFEQATLFIESFPLFFDNAQATVEAWNEQLSGNVPEEIRQQIADAFENAGVILIGSGVGAR